MGAVLVTLLAHISSSSVPAHFNETFSVAEKFIVPLIDVAVVVLDNVSRRLLYNVAAVEARKPHLLALVAG